MVLEFLSFRAVELMRRMLAWYLRLRWMRIFTEFLQPVEGSRVNKIR
jgi:hypothetical protein